LIDPLIPVSNSALSAITDFGDLALAVPLTAIMLLWLIAARSEIGAAWWIAAVALCAGGTALLKIYFFACPPTPELHSPSGHTSLSTLIYGALAVVIALAAQGWWRRLFILGAGASLILAIAASRVALSAHSTIEVALGLGIGAAALSAFAWGYLRDPPARPRLPALLLAVVVTMAVLHGSNLRAEEILHALGTYIGVGAIACSGA
jgi:membrane-associated phospholipid phosphatase